MKKKVLFVITKGNFGGAQRYVYDLATSLPKPKFEPVVASGEGDLLSQKLAETGVRTIKIDSLAREVSSKDWGALKSLVKMIQEEKPDVVHFNSSKIGFLGAIAVLYLRIFASAPRSIFTSHGWAFNERSRSASSRIIYYLAHYLTVLICDTTIAVSERTKQDIAWLPFIGKKIVVIHNGIDKFDTLEREAAREKLSGGDTGKTIILSIAELHNNKGLDVALKAIKLLPESIKEKVHYCIIGEGEERENLEQLAADLDIESEIRLLGFVDNAKSFLPGADLFLSPSRTENLPFAILEAGLCGLPIIATNVGGISEIITDLENGVLVHKENPKEIAEAIKYMLENTKRKEEMALKIQKVVSKRFSKTKMVKETVTLY